MLWREEACAGVEVSIGVGGVQCHAQGRVGKMRNDRSEKGSSGDSSRGEGRRTERGGGDTTAAEGVKELKGKGSGKRVDATMQMRSGKGLGPEGDGGRESEMQSGRAERDGVARRPLPSGGVLLARSGCYQQNAETQVHDEACAA